MDFEINLYDYLITGAMLMIILLGIMASSTMPGIERFSRRYFIAFYSVLLLVCAIFCIDTVTYLNPSFWVWDVIASFLEYFLHSILFLLVTAYLFHCCGEDLKHSRPFLYIWALWGVFFLLLILTQFTTCFYYVTPDNRFYRGKLHPLLLSPMVGMVAINLYVVITRRRRLSRRRFFAFLACLVPLAVTIIIHSFEYAILAVILCVGIGSLVMYTIIMIEQVEQYMHQQGKIADQRVSIMILQMRPHFIYNTMMSIYYLCDQDSEKAQQVTRDFTLYLQKTFTAIASEKPIPFLEELEHTRVYLEVEKAQFEDMLFIDLDIGHTSFSLPPLTLQPIVENAVKHGMDPDSDPLHVLIQTRRTQSGSVILVEDNGAGFDPGDISGPHLALTNIRQRLEWMCHGSIHISAREGGGTVVRVTIPG